MKKQNSPEKNILVADDCAPMRYMLVGLLKKNTNYNFNVFQAKNGLEALKIIQTNKDIDLIFVDLHMPELDGIQFTLKLRSSPQKTMPVIMLTAEVRKELILQAIHSGIDDYLIKPLSYETLQEKLDKFIKPKKKSLNDNNRKLKNQ